VDCRPRAISAIETKISCPRDLAPQFNVRTQPAMDGHVLMLGATSFDGAIKSHDPILVKFYATWYGAHTVSRSFV
jgi:hypothetical protein